MFFALIGVLIAFFGFVFKYVDSKFSALDRDLDNRFERQELLLKLHEALHHKTGEDN